MATIDTGATTIDLENNSDHNMKIYQLIDTGRWVFGQHNVILVLTFSKAFNSVISIFALFTTFEALGHSLENCSVAIPFISQGRAPDKLGIQTHTMDNRDTNEIGTMKDYLIMPDNNLLKISNK
uniref:Uncharacterized protein n=1 Tax=Glossina palpalis gambiensis TaxID=67801 RepID=A0A1B0B3R7_9MUSC